MSDQSTVVHTEGDGSGSTSSATAYGNHLAAKVNDSPV